MVKDPLLPDAKKFILETKQTSISALQRHLRIGFMRATRMMEQLEKEGFVSKADKYLKREILGDK
ncbi:DNA translocase FtsK [Haemophilus parahaemolyticus]|uniref:DNA translocase FtsK n=1 Tax=Haemophilus parahaemolyticus TaxID=735 RepID=UPI00249390B4|nr:DNA translocase FtsK [Haemophilus parahaemolyticus]